MEALNLLTLSAVMFLFGIDFAESCANESAKLWVKSTLRVIETVLCAISIVCIISDYLSH